MVSCDNWDVDSDTINGLTQMPSSTGTCVGGSSVKCSHIYCVSMATNTVATSEKSDWLATFIMLSTKPVHPFSLIS